MNFFRGLRRAFNWAFNVFVLAALWFYDKADWPIIGGVCETLGDVCNDLTDFCADCIGELVDAEDWWEEVSDAVEGILNWSTIRSLIRSWLTGIETLIEWFTDWVTLVTGVIGDWWEDVQTTVTGWINEAKEALQELIDDLETWLGSLQEAWDNFKGKIPSIDEVLTWFSNWWAAILIPLTAWWNERLLDVNTLIINTLQEWFPFYNDLVALWEDIKAFFIDPLQWVYDRLDDWFERFW